jgi:hypothetical protein
MGRKSAAKQGQQQGPQGPPPGAKASGANPLLIGVIVVVLAGGGLLFWTSRGGEAPTDAAAPAADSASKPAVVPAANAVSEQNQKSADAIAAFGPRKQAVLPPIPFAGYAPPRPAEVVTAAYHFAAEHPEILSYVPCFCGCERAGHKGNHDCFVKSRAVNGDVLEWDEHGVECAVCIDVATKSRQMYSSGASARDIRAAIDKQYAGAPAHTPTAHPPGHAGN